MNEKPQIVDGGVYKMEHIKLQNIEYCLEIIKKLKEQIEDEEAVCDIEKAIDLVRQWLNYKNDISEDLYNLLDNEEHSFTIYQEAETDEYMIETWNCIIDAVAYICRKIYENK